MHRSYWTPRYQLRQRSTFLPISLLKNVQSSHIWGVIHVQEGILYKNKDSTVINLLYLYTVYIRTWTIRTFGNNQTLKILNVEMDFAPEHTSDENREECW